MLSGDITTGVLGFVKIGDREWTPEELNALKAIASLFAQLQARIVAEDQLRFLAEHDDLTGLNNRRALIAHLDKRLAAGQPGPVSALFLDLDRLKAINDYLGHTAGDWFIRVFSKRLREGAEGPNLIARLGGDEFVVVPVAPMSAAEAETLAAELQATLRERVSIDGEMLTRTVSIGVALGVPGRDTTSDLLRRADQALLAAKSGRRQQDRGVLRRHVAQGRVPQRHRAASRECDRERRPCPALPARSRHAHRRDPRVRGAGALAAPDARPAVAQCLHRGGRIHQLRRRARPLGDARRLRRVPKVAIEGNRPRTPSCGSTSRRCSW